MRFHDERGFASLVIGAALFVAAPITMILAVQLWAFSDKEPHVVVFHAWLARVGVLITLATGAMSIALAWLATRTCKRRGRPAGMAIAGLFLSTAALVLWIITALGLLNTTESLLLNYR
jgi:hypothetical protein